MINIVPHVHRITDDVRFFFWNGSSFFHNVILQCMPVNRSPSFVEDGAMGKEEAAKMLGYLKYHQGSNETAVRTPDTHNGVAPSEKQFFLAQFAKNIDSTGDVQDQRRVVQENRNPAEERARQRGDERAWDNWRCNRSHRLRCRSQVSAQFTATVKKDLENATDWQECFGAQAH